ncbi:MAG: tyrosine-protein phosphatase [Prevotella sp.]|nr:tyrosine-protein phosphatase [Prevotella sp.]
MNHKFLIISFLLWLGFYSSHSQTIEEIDYYANLENNAVHRYMEEVVYEPNEASVINDYRNDGSYRKDWPNYVAMTIKNNNIDSVYIICRNEERLKDSLKFKVPVNNGKIKLYNLIPNRTYLYKILYDGQLLQQGKIKTDGQLRMIKIPGNVSNIRDLGGWKTIDNKTIKYGRIIRGTELNGKHSVTEEGISILRELGIKAELDLRAYYNEGNNVSVFGFLDENSTPSRDVPTYCYTNNSGQLPEHLDNFNWLYRWRKEFQFIVNNLSEGRCIYEHCVYGKDRTGYLSFLLEGLLGVPYNELIKDYELTYFYNKKESTKSSIDEALEYIYQQEGETLRDKFNSFFINKLSVSQDDIDYFRDEMLDDPNSHIVIDKGDANDDGEVDTKDIVDIVNHMMGKQTSTGYFNEEEADINGDNVITIADIVKIVKHIILSW